MSNKNRIVISAFVVASFVMGFGGYLAFKPGSSDASRIKNTSMVGKPRPDFSMNDLSGKPHSIKEWDGKVILLNFWATWCPPCRREIPAFINIYDKYHAKGFMIVGVALDSKQNAIDFVDPMGINYPIVVGEEDGIALTQAYGNDLGILPYSVLIDRHGVIRQTLRHELTQEQAEALITPLL